MNIIKGSDLKIGDKVLVSQNTFMSGNSSLKSRMFCNFIIREVTKNNLITIPEALSLILVNNKNVSDCIYKEYTYIIFDEYDSTNLLDAYSIKSNDRKQYCYDIRGKALQTGSFVIVFDNDKLGDFSDAKYGLSLGKKVFTENGYSNVKRALLVENPSKNQMSIYHKLVNEYKKLEKQLYTFKRGTEVPGTICVATNDSTKYLYLGYREVKRFNQSMYRHVYIKLELKRDIGKYLYEWLITGYVREDKMTDREKFIYKNYDIYEPFSQYNILDVLKVFIKLGGKKKDGSYKYLVTTVNKKTFFRYINVKIDLQLALDELVLEDNTILGNV